MTYEAPKIVTLGKVESLTRGKPCCGEPDFLNRLFPF